jgi:DNA-binding response OmpR family regulator
VGKILIVDDDPYIRELVGAILKKEGFEICEAVDGRDALIKLDDGKTDLCVVDVMMPNMDGFEFCKMARRYYADLPILFLTAKGDVSQKVRGFDLGADDYLVKPFESAELAARVKALMKRYQVISSQRIKIGKLTMDKDSHTVETSAGEKADIPLKEFDLLFYLGGLPGKTRTRDQLIEEIWGYDFDGNERTLDVHIGRLRERFPAAEYGFRIATVRGLGYRLEADCE